MIGRLKRFFSSLSRVEFTVTGPFHIPPRKLSVGECRIRPFAESDFETCTEIYRLNEPGRFPAGYFDLFCEWIRSGRDLVLVCEAGGEIRALGGIDMYRHDSLDFATLNFGMVHPMHHKQGYGTALLLARLATLPRPDPDWIVVMATTGGSETFYQRFGFVRARGFTDDRGTEFGDYQLRLTLADWQACRDTLASSSVALDTAHVTIPAIAVDTNERSRSTND